MGNLNYDPKDTTCIRPIPYVLNQEITHTCFGGKVDPRASWHMHSKSNLQLLAGARFSPPKNRENKSVKDLRLHTNRKYDGI